MAEDRVNSDTVTTGVSDNLTGRQEPSEWSQVEARGLGICVPLEIFRYGIPLGKRHSLGKEASFGRGEFSSRDLTLRWQQSVHIGSEVVSA